MLPQGLWLMQHEAPACHVEAPFIRRPAQPQTQVACSLSCGECHAAQPVRMTYNAQWFYRFTGTLLALTLGNVNCLSKATDQGLHTALQDVTPAIAGVWCT